MINNNNVSRLVCHSYMQLWSQSPLVVFNNAKFLPKWLIFKIITIITIIGTNFPSLEGTSHVTSIKYMQDYHLKRDKKIANPAKTDCYFGFALLKQETTELVFEDFV